MSVKEITVRPSWQDKYGPFILAAILIAAVVVRWHYGLPAYAPL